MRVKFALPLIFLVISVPVFSQVTAAATQGGIPISIGAGFSNFNMDWGTTRMDGGTLWLDWNPNHLPAILRGLGLELEARDISLNRGDKPKNFRTDTVGGGPTYTWRHYRNFHPYLKGIVGDGNIDFQVRNSSVTHINWNVYAVGGGVNYRVFKSIWVRGDYEYQGWFDIFNNNKVLDPQGFTVGAVYDFGHPHYH